MAPTTRRAGAGALDVIVVHGSDSDSDAVAEKSPPRKHTSKRQKTGTGSQDRKSTSLSEDEDEDEDGDHEIDSDFATTPSPLPLPSMAPKHKVVYNADKNAHLKGRRRFVADLADMKEECETAGGFEVQGLRVSKIRAGDDEGSIEVKVSKAGVHVLAVNLLISDTSDYPKNHTFFAFSPDSGVPPDLSEVVDTISTAASRPIRAAIQKVILDLAKVVNPQQGSQSQSQETEIEDEDEGEGDDFEDYDGYDFDDYTSGHHTNGIPALDLGRLQHDFLDTVASGYRPGLIRYGIDDFSLSVSIPVVSLAESISPRALMAWDRRLLSRTQYLTLLISGMSGKYPFIASDGTIPRGMTITFKVGLTKRYKPSKEHAKDVGRTFGLIGADAEDEIRAEAELREKQMEWAGDDIALLPEDDGTPMIIDTAQDEEEDDGKFDRFSLSSSLESLLDQVLLTVIQFRRKFGLGWAGAETLFSEVERTQRRPEDVFETMKSEILKADQIEAKLGQTYDLPHDALVALNKTDQINLPLTAFSYLVRRLTLCTRYCIVCHNPINTDFEALKPYVCDSKLCSYQYYSLNRGPSLEYEIRNNPDTVDLLVSIAYSAAAELVIEDPLPIGMGLRVPVPDPKRCLVNPANNNVVPQGTPAPAPAVAKPPPTVDAAGLCEFDDLDLFQMRASIAQLIDSLPPVYDMKKHLERKVKAGKYKPKLKDMDPNVLPSAWSILRWCVASCTAHLEEITSPEERVQNLDPAWRQFRFSVGAPDAESKFKRAVEDAQKVDKNAKKYPSLYAFHGSAVRNWHSIIRHGLWFKNVANGRAYGHGVYLAKDGTVSMGHYAAPSRTAWRNSRISPTNCVALAEIVNLPSEFVSSNPYFVVKDTHWIVCRYLLVKSLDPPLEDPNTVDPVSINVPMVPLDPAHPVTLSGAKSASQIKIPQPSHQLEMLLAARKAEYFIEEHDEEDLAVFQYKPSAVENGSSQSRKEEIVLSDDDDDDGMDIDYYDDDDQPPPTKTGSAKGKAKAVQNSRSANDWQHDAEWVNSAVELLMPPPVEANPSATMAVQRELRSMLSEQDKALNSKGGLSELGWYMPPDLIGDNLFQWIVEMHSFDQDLPIAQDLKAKGVNSLIFEIRFPPSFPNTPPFFRIITPRFLPFIHGGGGHVTGGGSMCMDLLTSSGWVPTYSIPAVLMQIKLAISNLEPRPARLSPDWQKPYAIGEALEGYKRAAATHGWKLPEGLDKLAR